MNPSKIWNAVASVMCVSIKDIMSRRREKQIALARQIAMYYTYKTGNTFEECGRMFNRDHATIMYAVKRITEWRVDSYGHQPPVREILDKVDEAIPALARTHEIKYTCT